MQVLEVFLEGLSQVPGGSGGISGRLDRQGSGSLGSERMLCRYLEGSGGTFCWGLTST